MVISSQVMFSLATTFSKLATTGIANANEINEKLSPEVRILLRQQVLEMVELRRIIWKHGASVTNSTTRPAWSKGGRTRQAEDDAGLARQVDVVLREGGLDESPTITSTGHASKNLKLLAA
jgi:hypothetical protein